MASSSHTHHTDPAVNSSAIAELSSWSNKAREGPINQVLNRVVKSRISASDGHSERVAKKFDTLPHNLDGHVKDREYVCLLDIVRAFLETNGGKQGSEIQTSQFQELLMALVESSDCFDIAAIAFFATLDRTTLEPHIQSRIELAIQRHIRAPEYYGQNAQLDIVYSHFLGDADRYRNRSQNANISVLDVRRFAYNSLYRSSQYRPSFAFHWTVNDIDQLPEDALSEPFQVHGIKCKLRFCKKITLTNGETWTGMWLHNVSSGCKVLDIKFALVASNIAYPTVYCAQVVSPTDGIRPSQGIGVKLFAKLGNLSRQTNNNQQPIIDCNSLRLSIVYI